MHLTNKKISYEEVTRIRYLLHSDQLDSKSWESTTEELGLVSKHSYGAWINTESRSSFLYVEDEKKWLLAKIKYGI